ncbi:MAG: AsmA family protein [Candidatus Omnitrophota bacterium]
MKILFRILIAVFCLLILVITLFVLTFRADQYRPYVIQALESSLKMPVEIQGLALEWRDGIALKADGVAIYERQEDDEPLLKIDSIHGALEVMPLLQGRIHIGSIEIEGPVYRLVLRPLTEEDSAAQAAAEDGEAKNAAAVAVPFVFLVDRITVEHGRFIFRDETLAQPSEISADDLSLQIRDVSLTSPVLVSVQGSLLGPRENFTAEVSVSVDWKNGGVILRNGQAQLSLGTLDLRKAAPWVPALASAADSRLTGKLGLKIRELSWNAEKLATLQANAWIEEGGLQLSPGVEPFQNVSAEAQADMRQIEIRSLSARVGDGDLSASARARDWQEIPSLEFQLTGKNMRAEKVFPAAEPGAPSIEGNMALAVEGGSAQVPWEGITQAAVARGQWTLAEGKIRDLNLLREVLDQISVIPGLGDKLQNRLPAEYEEKLKAKDTPLAPLTVPFSLQAGIITIPQTEIAADGFGVKGGLRSDLQGQIDGRGILAVDPGLSEAMCRTIEELRELTNAQGAIEIPVYAQGRLPSVQVMPDLIDIGKKLAAVKVQEMIDKWIRKPDPADPGASSGGPVTEPGDPQDSGSSAATKPQSIFDLILSEVEKRTQPQSGTKAS